MSRITDYLSFDSFNKMKISNYNGIQVVKDMECPECHVSCVHGSGAAFQPDANMIGWCDTDNGLMGVFECPKCFTKFRCHIDDGGRWNIESFYEDFALFYYMENKHRS